MNADKLQKAFKFTDADLKANREGYMTKAQRHELSRYRANLPLFAVLVSIAPFVFLIIDFSISGAITIGIMTVFIVSICVAFFVAYLLLWQWRNTKKDLKKGDVVTFRGQLDQQETTIAIIDVEGNHFEIFDIPLEAVEGFEKGATYSVYYAPATRQILSVEKLNT